MHMSRPTFIIYKLLDMQYNKCTDSHPTINTKLKLSGLVWDGLLNPKVIL